MHGWPDILTLPWRVTPMQALAAWPVDRPVLMLHSGRVHANWARWSILASPLCRYQFVDGRSRWIGDPPTQAAAQVRFTHDPLTDLDAVLCATKPAGPKANARHPSVPFRGGWLGYFSYDLGRWIEPKAQAQAGGETGHDWPLIDMAYCPAALICDNVQQQWFAVGESIQYPKSKAQDRDFAIGPLSPEIDPDHYMSMVSRTIEYIGAGDVFQANIAQRFSASYSGSTRQLCHTAFARSQPWYGAYLELDDAPTADCGRDASAQARRVLLSLSPELFLQFDPGARQVITRPIKGTRPGGSSPRRLLDSPKDAAELHMIIDLMRNDLGRVCEFGSVRVPNPRVIESHPTVHHGVGEVIGRMRRAVSFGDLLRATFPGGSVTGAPKIRAMQIIDELETVRRGPYCGAVGYISDCGAACFNIAIRTILLQGQRAGPAVDELLGTLQYSAGAGIVADSQPISEYRESLDKAAVLRMICRLQPDRVGATAGA